MMPSFLYLKARAVEMGGGGGGGGGWKEGGIENFDLNTSKEIFWKAFLWNVLKHS